MQPLATTQQRQLEKLNFLLQELRKSNPFYRQKIEQSGLGLPLLSFNDFFACFPLTTKSEIEADQKANPPFGTNLTFPLERYVRFSQTSGSTGRPIHWLDTPESWRWMLEKWIAVFQAAKVYAEDRVFFAFSFGPFLGLWTAFEAAQAVGCLTIPGGGSNSISRLELIIKLQATVLCCTPTYALHLAEVARKEGVDLAKSQVQKIFVAGEPGGSIPATRNRIETLWNGARVFDQHGLTEVGPASYERVDRPGTLFILGKAFIPEVVDPKTLKEVDAGETGELILTNLGRIGSPLLRYRTGDLVRKGEFIPGQFGTQDLALEGGILGRSDDMVLVRGVNVYPAAVESVLREFEEIAEYRVFVKKQNEMVELMIEIEFDAAHGAVEESRAQIQKALRLAFSLRIPVEVVPAGHLPRYEMKAKRWIRE